MCVPELKIMDMIFQIIFGGEIMLILDHRLAGVVMLPKIEGFGCMFEFKIRKRWFIALH